MHSEICRSPARNALSSALALLLTLVGGFCAPALAGTPPAQPAGSTDLSPTPVDITVSVAPNIALTFDDSGSMSFGYMPDDVLPANNESSCDIKYTWSGYNKIYYNPQTTYVPPLDKDGNSFPDINFNSAPLDGYSMALGFGFDKIDLRSEYAPTIEWDRYDVRAHMNRVMRPACVQFQTNPVYEYLDNNNDWVHSEKVNARSSLAQYASYPFGSQKYSGYSYYYGGPAYYTYPDARGVYQTLSLTGSNIGAVIDGNKRTDTEERQNFANWYSYYRTRNLMTKTSVSRAFANVSGDVRVVWQTIWPYNNKTKPWSVAIDLTKSTIDALVVQKTDKSTDDTVKNNFFDWLQKIESSNSTPDRAATIRVGKFFSKSDTSLSTKNPNWNGKASKADGGTSLTCRKNFHILVTDGYWNESDTEIASGLDNSESATTLPDGKPYGVNTSNTYVYSNVNNGRSGINAKSLANIAFNYWATDLQPNLANNVKPLWTDVSGLTAGKTNFTDNGVYFNSKNDPATWQHLSQYVVTLGVPGNLAFPDDYAALVAGTKSWGRAEGGTATALDDMWHAAINSRGGYFSASDPQTLVDALTSILNNVAAGTNSAVSGSLNSAVLAAGALSYATSYDSTDWSGSVTGNTVDPLTGDIGDVKWNALDKLPSASGRKIYTGKLASGKVTGTDFTSANWSNLGADQQAWLETQPYSDPSSVNSTNPTGVQLAKDRIDWLRGVQTKEVTGGFRKRGKNLLGAVINSQAKYVGYPANGYRDFFPKNGSTNAPEIAAGMSYEKFIADNFDRPAMVYVGGNDGMLHAYDASLKCAKKDSKGNCTAYGPEPSATAGTEKWAYVPYSVYPNLSKLPDSQFTSRFVPTVDGSPVSRDVFFSSGTNNGWHTILVGGLRYGGRGVYALDVTDPDAMANSKVLWEFNDQSVGSDPTKLDKGKNPANLGLTYGQPNVARLASGEWVVLIPSGYFPTCDKQFSPVPCPVIPAAKNTRSSLFVVNAQTGVLIKEMRTPATLVSHGLTSPVVGDYDNNQVDDVAFAGDLDGNVWRFDLGKVSISDTDVSAGVTQLFKPEKAGDQPVTVMPRLFPDPKTQNLIVVFGTGKYLTAEDNVTDTSTVVQSVYGIRDKRSTDGISTATVSGKRTDKQLIAQTLVETTVTDPDTKVTETARGISNVEVPADKGGWYFDLNVQGTDNKPAARGERVVVTPAALFDSNRVLISTLIPRGDDPCDPRRDGALMVVDAATGGSGAGLSYPAAPPNWPNSAGSNTKVAGARVKNPPTGGSLPVASRVGGGQLLVPGVQLLNGSAFKIDDALWRRRSWRELINDQ